MKYVFYSFGTNRGSSIFSSVGEFFNHEIHYVIALAAKVEGNSSVAWYCIGNTGVCMNLSSFQVVYHIGVKAEGVSCCDYEACCVKSADAKVGAGTVGLLANDIITDMGSGAIIRGSFGWIGSHLSTIDASLQALVTNGKARILSRPSITTMSGKTANILIGGRIPIPTSAGDGEISIDWREYGIRLNIEPVVDGENKITSKVHAEVSTLDYGHAVVENNFSIPALASREADAVINVRSGATMAIGGLLNSEDSKTVSKIPLLGDLPIIGQFFRHTSKTRDNRELLILITPTLVSDDTEQPMSQQMKRGYEASQRMIRNREDVNLNQPVEQGTDKQERDLWGEKEAPVSTVVVEEKKPEEPVEHLLQVKGKNGETTLIPLSEEDYQKRKNDLQIVKVERDDGTEKQQPVQIQRKQGPEKKFSSPEKKSDVTPKESSSEPDIRDRVRAIMNAYSSDRT